MRLDPRRLVGRWGSRSIGVAAWSYTLSCILRASITRSGSV
jgi:hypothetical protein